MKIALITDTHYGVRNDNSVFYDYFKKSMEWFLDIVKREDAGAIIHLGDLYDRRKYVNFVTANRCRKDFLEPINELGIPVHIIAGNHDEYFKDSYRINSLRELVGGRFDNIRIYSSPATISIDDLDILLMPWIPEANDDRKRALDAIESSTAEILMGHLDLKGFEEHKGSISDHGLDRGIFSKFSVVYSGHFHHRSTSDNITYLGAFTEHSWSDYNDPRGFSIFDTETRKIEFYRNPFSMFQMYPYDDINTLNILEYINKADFSGMTNTYVKIIATNKTNPYAFDLMIDKLYKANPINISVVEDISTFVETDEDSEIDQAEDTPTILSKYIDGLTLSVEPDKMKRLMTSIYTEALTYNMEI